jgi:hypothetical protein
MPNTTKKLISDQVLYKLYGGTPDAASPVDERDIWKALEQKVNGLFKLHQFDTNLPSGEIIPEHSMLATYEGNDVVSSGEKSYALLPVQPISLPKNMGIFLVYDPNYPDMPFIPLQKGMTALLRTDSLLSDIMGQISYTPGNDRIVFNQDLTTLGIDEVTMELCVLDISQYTINQYLPIPSDYEERIVNELVQEFAPVTAESGEVNNWTTQGQQNVVKK